MCRAQRGFLARKVFDCEGTLAEAKADRKETERDRKIHEAVSNLKRLFPGQLVTHTFCLLNLQLPCTGFCSNARLCQHQPTSFARDQSECYDAQHVFCFLVVLVSAAALDLASCKWIQADYRSD